MRQRIVPMIEEYGTNNIYAFHLSTGPGGRDSEGSRKPLTVEDAAAIQAQSGAVDDIALIAPGIANYGPSFDDNITWRLERDYDYNDSRYIV